MIKPEEFGASDWLHTGKLVLITGLTQAPLSSLGPGAVSRLSDTSAVAARDFSPTAFRATTQVPTLKSSPV